MLSRIIRGAGMMYDLALSSLFHHHIPANPEAAEPLNQIRESKEEKIISHDATPLEKHMLTFANSDGYVDANSIYLSIIFDWHLPHHEAVRLAEATMQVAYYQNVPGVHMTLRGIEGRFRPREAIGLLTHPFDTGIYSMQSGMVDKERFSALRRHSVRDTDGVRMISERKMRAFLDEWHAVDKRWDHADPLLKLIGKAGNKGEFELFFSRVTDRKVGDERFVTLPRLKQFYLDSAPTIAAIKAKTLPASPSTSMSGSTHKAIKKHIKSAVPALKPSLFDKMMDCATEYARGVVKECPSYFPPGQPDYWNFSSPALFHAQEKCPVRAPMPAISHQPVHLLRWGSFTNGA